MPPDNRLNDLTAREREVLDLIHLGLTNEEIAGRLGITEAGVKYHVSQILSKLGVSTREEAARVALHAPTPHVAEPTTVAEAFQPRRGRWWVALPLAAKAAGVAVVLAAVGGLGLLAWGVVRTSDDEGAAGVQQRGPTPIPWLDAPPAPTPSPSPERTPDPAALALRHCNGGDLEALKPPGGVATGTNYVPIAFANKADTPCRLQGMPDVQLLDSSGAPVPVEFRDASCFSGSQDCMLGLPVVLEPGLTELRPDAQPIPGQALVHLAFSTTGPPPCNQDTPYAVTIRLGLPEAGGSLDLALRPNASPPGLQVCYPVGLTQFEDPALIWATPAASPLFASIEGPAEARRGETVHLLVTLRNITESGLSFDQPCPNYTLHIGGEKPGIIAQHVLNCAPAGVLDPGESVTFEVMAALPRSMPLGSQTLNWSLDRPPASAALQIEIVTG